MVGLCAFTTRSTSKQALVLHAAYVHDLNVLCQQVFLRHLIGTELSLLAKDQICDQARGGAFQTKQAAPSLMKRPLLSGATHSTVPSSALTFSSPHCSSSGSLHWCSTSCCKARYALPVAGVAVFEERRELAARSFLDVCDDEMAPSRSASGMALSSRAWNAWTASASSVLRPLLEAQDLLPRALAVRCSCRC